MSLSAIEELLAARLGFDAGAIGSKAVVTMVKRAMEQAGFAEPRTYARALERDRGAWDHFVDQVVIPETWFFRDVAPFELAIELVRSHLARASDQALHILSCPCSTGEEPYSILLALLHAGAPQGSFSIDAVDVSRRALDCARTAVFSPRSFRGELPWDLASYFHPAGRDGSRRLDASARAMVRFRQGNIVEPGFLAEDTPYGLVFCRNLLIYLLPEARRTVMSALRRLLADDGVLILGHAEAAFAREHGLRPTGPSGAFAFRKSSDRSQPSHGTVRVKNHAVKPRVLSLRERSAPPAVHPPAQIEAVNDQTALDEPVGPSLLAKASQLGDAGELEAALRVCSEYLQHVPDSPEGYFLLGVLYDALGHIDLAASSFRKVLYLNPRHEEALLCLALKQEARGDNRGAALLRARARRAQPPDGTKHHGQ